MPRTSSSPPNGAAHHRGDLVRLVGLVGAALVAVNASGPALGIALPELATDLRAGQAQTTWISTVSSVVSAAVLLPVGLSADRLGRRRFLVAGLLLFGAAEIGTALAGDPVVVIVLRALAGLGAACVLPTALAVLVAAFGVEQRARAIAIWAATVSVSASLGGLLSGQLTTTVSWRATPAVLGVLALVLVLPVGRVVPDSRNPDAAPDPLGGLLALVGIGALVLGIGAAGQSSFLEPVVLVPTLVGLLVLAGFVGWELTTDRPMLPLRLFADRTLRAGALLLVLVTGAFGAYTFIAVQYLQTVRGQSSLQSALTFLVTEVGVVATSVLLPAVVRRAGVRWSGTAGAGVVAAAFLLLAAVAGGVAFWPIALALLLLGVGFALAITPASTLVVGGLPADRLTVASSVNYVGRDVGSALGTAVVGAVLLAVYQSRIAPTTAALPGAQGEEVGSGVNAATGLIEQLGPAGTVLLDPVRDAYLGAFQAGAVTAGVVAALGALACALLAPAGITSTRDISPELPDPIPTERNAP